MKLKPCPFCGGKAARDETPEGGRYIQCSKCHASSALMFPDKCDVRELLAERWNYRVPSDGNYADPVERMTDTARSAR